MVNGFVMCTENLLEMRDFTQRQTLDQVRNCGTLVFIISVIAFLGMGETFSKIEVRYCGMCFL